MTGALDGQVALVTGSGRGIGRAVALALAESGAAVAASARSAGQIAETVALIEATGGRAVAIPADVADATAVAELVQQMERALGPVTLLVNNAGTAGPVGTDWEVDPDAWWECIDVSLRGAFLCNRAVVPGMIAQGGGRVIHMASTTGTRAVPQVTATSVAKTALIRLAEGLALQGTAHGMRSFAVHPGVVRTELLESYGMRFPDSAYSPPERAGALCVRLASGRYDALSGRFLTVDDDLDALLSRVDVIEARQLHTLRLQASDP